MDKPRTFAQDIKPLNHGKYRSWVKELDSENLVYLYVYIKQHRQAAKACI